ncbi:GIN domain-containing protein [Pedobacter sp. KLB.chiD]|uniref:GIN domain-containing protein n=1 Tax=Pedobacter sp. KLB.chiD TaxID=3387402 RepID=UPI00399B5543
MKTLLKTLFASSLALVLSTSAVVSVHATETIKPVHASKPLNFKRIKVSGNVELTIIQGKRTGISYTDENSGEVKVMQSGDGLEITALDNSSAKLTIYVNDLYRIHAMDHAKVKTQGKINTQYLQVFLSGNASLELNSQTEGLYTVIEDQADLTLSGSTKDHMLVMGQGQKLTMDKFVAANTKTSLNTDIAIALISK